MQTHLTLLVTSVVASFPGSFVFAAATLDRVAPVDSYQPLLVTSDNPGNTPSHLTSPGTPAFGVNVDGVADLIVTIPGVGSFRGTGSLLLSGNTLLTAAHVVTNSSGAFVPGTTATAKFETPTGNVFVPVLNFFVHPSYNGDLSEGNDVAVVQLSGSAPVNVPRYDIYRGTSEVGATGIKVGYGLSGYGQTGLVNGTSGTKRAGLNEYDNDARPILSQFGGGVNPFDGGPLPAAGLSLIYDFDSGNAANNLFNNNDLGFGADEVNAAPGDSGGPTFINDGGVYKIMGVTSYGFGFNANPPDTNPGTNSSWGELTVDMRVAGYQSFLNAYVPEPTLLSVLALGAFVAVRRRRVTDTAG